MRVVVDFFKSLRKNRIQGIPIHTSRKHILIDAGVNTVLAIDSDLSLILSLREMIPDSLGIPDIHFHVSPTELPKLSVNCSCYPEWSWRSVAPKAFIPTRQDTISDDMIAKSLLAAAKLQVLRRIQYQVDIARAAITPSSNGGQTVYAAKKMEARAFQESGYQDMQPYPYVAQYAHCTGLSPEQAAREILFKAKLADDILFKTEAFRLTYTEQLRNVTTPEDAGKLLQKVTSAL